MPGNMREKDNLLWGAWKKDPNKDNLTSLFKQVNPILQKEVNRWSGGSVAAPVLNINAKKMALQAFQTYDPNKSALSTHVTNQLKGLSRDPYTYINPARMPEHRQIKFKTYTDSQERLTEELGRTPTAAEMSQDLSWSLAETGRFRKELRTEYSTSQPVPPGFENEDITSGVMTYVYHDLPPQDQLVLEHSTGFGGAPILSAKALTQKTGLSQGQISHSKRRIKSHIEQAMGLN